MLGDLGGAFVKGIVYAELSGDYTVTFQTDADAEGTDFTIHAIERGAWVNNHTYQRGDVVLHDSKTWMSLTASHSNNAPSASNIHWSEQQDGASLVDSNSTSGTAGPYRRRRGRCLHSG